MSLRIAIVGYGQMGKAVETVATRRGHRISHIVKVPGDPAMAKISPENTDVAIEFTAPSEAKGNYVALLHKGIPVVTGTTAWESEKEAVMDLVEENEGAFLWASNFSIGVNIMFKLNEKLASLMNAYPDYDVLVEEKHHKLKQDGPSGTAKSLGNQIIKGLDRKDAMVSGELGHRAPAENELSMGFTRAGRIIGEHSVVYTSEIDEITLSHRAFNRSGFAQGAVVAAEWLVGKKGFYNFGDIFE